MLWLSLSRRALSSSRHRDPLSRLAIVAAQVRASGLAQGAQAQRRACAESCFPLCMQTLSTGADANGSSAGAVAAATAQQAEELNAELLEFFGAPDVTAAPAAKLPEPAGPSQPAGGAAPAAESRSPGKRRRAASAGLSHVDSAGRAAMVDVGAVIPPSLPLCRCSAAQLTGADAPLATCRPALSPWWGCCVPRRSRRRSAARPPAQQWNWVLRFIASWLATPWPRATSSPWRTWRVGGAGRVEEGRRRP